MAKPKATIEYKESVDDVLQRMQKELEEGERIVYNLAEGPKIERPDDLIPTGIVSLDYILGGGIQPGRIIEIYGKEGAGKTTLAYHLMAAVQRSRPEKKVVFVNAEYSLDDEYAQSCGCDPDRMIIVDADYGDQGLETAYQFINAGASMVVVDSVAGLVPRSELAGESGDAHMGLQARLMSQHLRRIGPGCKRTGCIALFTNQLRMNIGQMFGNPETTTGGRALPFWASARIDIRPVRSIKIGDMVVGIESKLKPTKLKWAAPLKSALVQIYFGEGISALADLLIWSVEKGFVIKSSNGYHYYVPVEGDKVTLGQGEAKAMETLRTETLLADELSDRIRESLFGNSSHA